jgi:hypothetical protein
VAGNKTSGGMVSPNKEQDACDNIHNNNNTRATKKVSKHKRKASKVPVSNR